MLPDIDPQTRQQAIAAWNSAGQYEPSILEYLVAQTYRLTGDEIFGGADLELAVLVDWWIGSI